MRNHRMVLVATIAVVVGLPSSQVSMPALRAPSFTALAGHDRDDDR